MRILIALWALTAIAPALHAAAQPAEGASIQVPTSQNTALKGEAQRLLDAARERTRQSVRYDGSYQTLAYPMGDVADDRGVCTDVIIRSYRAGLGLDLQRLVHEDMRTNFQLYPPLWGLKKPDRNIDHRRVPNLQTFFSRHGQSLPLVDSTADFIAGDILTWMLPGNLPHIGVVSDRSTADGARPLIIHNIGAGPQEEDALHVGELTGHYRFFPSSKQQMQN